VIPITGYENSCKAEQPAATACFNGPILASSLLAYIERSPARSRLLIPGQHTVTPTSGNVKRATKSTRAVATPARPRDRVGPIALVRDDLAFGEDGQDILGAQSIGRIVARCVKRLVDILGATIGLIIAAPVIIVAAIAIRLESRGPVFFAHRRLGRGGDPFDCWKFRSMHEDAERVLHADETLRHHYVSNHFKIPTHLDPRVTRLGRFLRKSSLDELPQLWNVLRGDMSLVGPRPIVPLESSYYAEELPVLLSVRPGLTGAWAVHGRSHVGYPTRASIELGYVRNWTLTTDLEILARTPAAVFTQRGAY
jgi:exopolysaccharide production protein ExoY